MTTQNLSAKQRAEIGVLAVALYDWHAGRISQRQWRYRAGAVANQEEIDRCEKISKYGYEGVDGLTPRVAKAYLGGE